jgi:hypothetical protein
MIAAVQQSVEQQGKSVGVVVSGPGASPVEQRIEEALNAPASLAVTEQPLEDVVQILQRQHRLPIRLDVRALDDVGIGTDVPITFRGTGLSLRTALTLILRPLDLTYQIAHEGVMITTPEEAEAELTTVIYPVSDLVRFRDADGDVWADYDTLIETITCTVAPASWDVVGGPGAIEGMQYQNTDVLILSQTQDVQREIGTLLTKLRAVAKADNRDGQIPQKERPDASDDPFGGNVSGMGGGLGGMGGGFFGGPSAPPTTADPGGVQPAAQGGANLLKGLQDTKHRLQGRQVDRLRDIYRKGMGGFGGSMGGGFF